MGLYLDSLKKHDISAYLSNGALVIDVPDGIDQDLIDKIHAKAKEIKEELVAIDLETNKPDSSEARKNTPLIAALRAKRKLGTCKGCQEPIEAIEYVQPSDGWHRCECSKCRLTSTVCLSAQSLQAAELQNKLDVQGWCLIQSRALDEPIVITKESGINLPSSLMGCIKYSLAECAVLNRSLLRSTHMIKRLFGGHLEKTTTEEMLLFG